MGEIQYKRSAHKAAELMGVLSNLAQVRLYSSYRHKWDYIYTGYTSVTDGRWCTKKRGNRVPWRGEWIVERLGYTNFSYFIILYSCPSDPNTQDPMKNTGASYFSCTSELPLHSPIKGKPLQQKQHSRLNALI